MKNIIKFTKRVFLRFVNVVTGTVVALYYIYVAPLISGRSYKPTLDLVVPAFALFIAFFLAWKDDQEEQRKLNLRISELEDKKPKYTFKLVDERSVLKDLIDEVDGLIKEARKKQANAPHQNPLLPVIDMFGPPTENAWGVYIDELEEYKKYIEEILDQDVGIKNIVITNKGATDTDIHITFDFEGAEQIPDFYDEYVESKRPHEPTSHLGIGYNFKSGVQKLGILREVHRNSENSMDIEIEKLRNGDNVRAYHDPIFLRQTTNEMKISYSLNSNLCKPISGSVRAK